MPLELQLSTEPSKNLIQEEQEVLSLLTSEFNMHQANTQELLLEQSQKMKLFLNSLQTLVTKTITDKSQELNGMISTQP